MMAGAGDEHRWVSDRLLRSIALTVDVDSDWAGDKRTRKWTLCVVVRHGVNVIKTQVNAMKGISLSSGEAEYAAIVGLSPCVPTGGLRRA